MDRHRSWFVAPLLLASLAAFDGCKPKVGDSCSQGDQACLDPSNGVFCGPDNKYQAMSCNGDGKGGGCSGSGASFACDNSVSALGDGCSTVGDVACTSDHKGALECSKDYKFVIGETCKGTGGCSIKGDAITCDNDTSDLGDPCHFDGDYACTSDQSLVLKCTDRKMTALNSCRGPKHCRVFQLPQEKKVQFDCDDSLAQDGDACDTANEQACSMDKKSMLTCTGGKFSSPQPCPGPAGCTHDEKNDTYACDPGAQAAMDAGAPAPMATSASAQAKGPKPPPPRKH